MNFSLLSHYVARVLRLLMAAALVPLLLGFLGPFHPAMDAFAHFRAHLAAAVMLIAIPLLLGRYWAQAAVSIALGLAAMTTIAQWLPFPSPAPVHASADDEDPAERATFRLLHLNLRFDNFEPEKVLSLIGRAEPDIVTLNEVSEQWRGKLDLLSASYPYRIICEVPRRIGGVAILSRRPFVEGREARCLDRGALAIAAVDFGGEWVDVAALHLSWPWPFEQPWQLANLVQPLRSLAGTAILAGDLNAAPWSDAAAQVARAGGLVGVKSIGATWLPPVLPEALRFAGLPIDNVFTRGRIRIRSAKTLAPVGSDHLPVMVDFTLKRVRGPTRHLVEAAPVGLVRGGQG